MADYRIYVLNAANVTCDYRVIRCKDDDAALSAATEMLDGLPGLEVWDGMRMVQRLTVGSASAAAAH